MRKIFLSIFLIFSICMFASVSISQTSVVKPRISNFFKEYDNYLEISEQFSLIPGLKEEYVPQGLGYISSEDWFVVSSYYSKGPSILSFLNGTTGEFIKSVIVLNEDGSNYTGHAGGVAVSKSNLWISSGSYLRKISLEKILSSKDGEEIRIESKFNAGTNASFAAYKNGVIWSGEFYRFDNYLTDPTHYQKIETGERNNAWITGFKLDETTDELINSIPIDASIPVTPDYIISVPDIVQGVAFLDNGKIALSKSYGRANDSVIQIYGFDSASTADVDIKGKSVPLWVLSNLNLERELLVLPMSEGIIQKDDYFYILYESAAKKYLITTKYATDYIWRIPIELLIN